MSTTDNQLSLTQYLESSIEMLRADTLTPGEFVINLFQYTQGKAYFTNHLDLANILLTADDISEAKKAALSIAENPSAFMLNEKQSRVISDNERIEMSKIHPDSAPEESPFSVPSGDFQNALNKKRQSAITTNREYIAGLVKQYGRDLNEQRLKLVLSELSAPPKSSNLIDARKEYEERIKSSTALAQDNEAKQFAQDVLGDNKFIEKAASITRQTETVVEAYLRQPDAPPTLIEAFIENTFDGAAINPIRAANIQHTATTTIAESSKIPLGYAFPNARGPKEAVINKAFSEGIRAVIKKEDDFAKTVGARFAENPTVQNILQSRESGGGMTNMVSGFLSAGSSSIEEDMQNYLTGLYNNDHNATPNAHGFFASVSHANHPEMFHFEFNGSLGKWLLNTGKKEVKSSLLQGMGRGALAKKLGSDFLLKLGLQSGSKLFALLNGPIGWALLIASTFSGTIKNIGGAALGKLAAGGFSSVQAAGGAIANLVQDMLGTHYRDPNENNAVLFALMLSALPILLVFFMTMNLIQTQRAQFSPTFIGSGEDGSSTSSSPGSTAPEISMGQANYSGPEPEGSLAQCVNYNVSDSPLSSAQTSELNSAMTQYNQLGLYGCLLQCPATKIDIKRGVGGGKLYGRAYTNHSIAFYDWMFQNEGGNGPTEIHSRARIIAHEFAHELSYYNNEVMQAFLHGTTGPQGIITRAIPRGYCGHRLCTYPSGHYGTCNESETTDETFAEAAAMYLTGEDLNALCPDSFTFMKQLFGQCAKKL